MAVCGSREGGARGASRSPRRGFRPLVGRISDDGRPAAGEADDLAPPGATVAVPVTSAVAGGAVDLPGHASAALSPFGGGEGGTRRKAEGLEQVELPRAHGHRHPLVGETLPTTSIRVVPARHRRGDASPAPTSARCWQRNRGSPGPSVAVHPQRGGPSGAPRIPRERGETGTAHSSRGVEGKTMTLIPARPNNVLPASAYARSAGWKWRAMFGSWDNGASSIFTGVIRADTCQTNDIILSVE